MITVLVLASSPLDLVQLHLGKESKLIRHTLDSARNREQYRVITCTATTADDLRRYMLEYTPSIVHFCGHGGGPAGLCLEDSEGNAHLVSGASLAKLFHLLNNEVKCVVLNACYSDEQGIPISEHIDFVVGMRDSVSDQSALKFAQGFYEAIWAGQSYERAFKFGCSAIDTAGLPDEKIPKLLRSARLGGGELPYGERTQELENFLLRYVNSPPSARIGMSVEGDAIAEFIQAYYHNLVLRRFDAVSVVGTRRVDDRVTEVVASVSRAAESHERTFYVAETADGPRLYWQATVGHCETPLATLKALGASGPVRVRVLVSLSDYYNYGVEPENAVSVRLGDLEGESLPAFMEREHPQIADLLGLLKDGRERRLTLSIEFLHPRNGFAQILSLLSQSWIVADASSTAA